jgi:hypothetical protein
MATALVSTLEECCRGLEAFGAGSRCTDKYVKVGDVDVWACEVNVGLVRIAVAATDPVVGKGLAALLVDVTREQQEGFLETSASGMRKRSLLDLLVGQLDVRSVEAA